MPLVHLPDGTNFEVPEGWDEEAVARAVRAHQTNKEGPGTALTIPEAAPDTAPRVPTSFPGQVEASPDRPWWWDQAHDPNVGDPSQTDDWPTWAGKQAKSLVRGTAKSLAQGVDAASGLFLETPWNTLQMARGEPYTPDKYEDPNDQPFTENRFEPNFYAQPRGSQYEDTADIGGPAAAALLSSGSSLYRAPIRAVAETARDYTLGVAGGKAGGAAGEALGGETGRELGEILGGAVTPGAVTKGGHAGLRAATTNERSLPALQATDRINAELARSGSQHRIPLSMGLHGNKGMSILEDITGRGVLTGGRANETRRQQYEGLEAAAQEAANRNRGSGHASVPASGKITPESIGNKASDMAVVAAERANKSMDYIQNQLTREVGADRPVDPEPIERELRSIIDNPHGGTRAQMRAQQLLDEFRRDYQYHTPRGDEIGPPQRPTEPSYGQVKELRSEVGQTVDPTTGRTMAQGQTKAAYKGATEAMRNTAAEAGIPPRVFDARQEATEQLARDREHANEIARGADNGRRPLREKPAYNRLFAGANKKGVENLETYQDLTPDMAPEVMADNFELLVRGEENAGMPMPVPESFDPQRGKNFWRSVGDEYRQTQTHGNPETQRLMDDFATVAEKEGVRAGQRTKPGKTGSTIGASMQLASPAVLGALLHGKVGAAVLPVLAAGGNAGLARLLTNPSVVRSLVDPAGLSLPDILRQAVAGAAGGYVTGGDAAKEKQQAEEEKRKYEKVR